MESHLWNEMLTYELLKCTRGLLASTPLLSRDGRLLLGLCTKTEGSRSLLKGDIWMAFCGGKHL